MDFSTINAKADAEEGAILHFTHPQLGHPLYTGEGADKLGVLINADLPHEPVTALVRGMESASVRAEAIRMEKVRVKTGKNDEAGMNFLCSLIIEISGVMDGKRAITATPADLKWFFGRSDDLGKQVLTFAQEASNFFKDASHS